MKKILTVILILATAFLLYFLGKMLPDIYLQLGQKDYATANYPKARLDLKTAMLFRPSDVTIRRFYAKTLINLPPTLDVQKELYKISQTQLHDSAELIADVQISKWRKQILSNIGPNYIDQVPFNEKILRWDVKKFPLSVCIRNNSSVAPKYYEAGIQKAFLQWQKASKFITFSFTSDPKQADIDVEINPLNEMKNCTGPDCKYTVAYTTPIISDNLLKQMNISFYDTNNLNKPFSQKEIYNSAIHEIGHALGIMGHSYNKDDIMYMETSQNKLDYMESDSQFISLTDLNTLNLLYRLLPDITNTRLSEFDTSHQFFAPIVMGNDEQINSKKALEALNYIKMAPNLPNGYIDLASAYAGENQYQKAIEALNTALSCSSHGDDNFIIYFNLGIIYMELKDWESALKYAQMANQLQQNAELDGIIAEINYELGNKELAKQTYLKSIEEDPTNVGNSVRLARIYFKEFNFVQTGKVLNGLIYKNPSARNDPRVQVFALFIFLFH